MLTFINLLINLPSFLPSKGTLMEKGFKELHTCDLE